MEVAKLWIRPMKSALSFLVAARQCEIADLEQLALTSELVSAIGRLTHALQKERGISNVFLGSHGARFGDRRLAQVMECEQVEQRVRGHFNGLNTDSGGVRNGARLFSRIAFVLQALDALPALRQRIVAQAVPAEEATAAMVRLIGGLLVVVFEAADSATDPEISRALVAMHHHVETTAQRFAHQYSKHSAIARNSKPAAARSAARVAVPESGDWISRTEVTVTRASTRKGCKRSASRPPLRPD